MSDDDRAQLLAAIDLGQLLEELAGIAARGQAFPCPDPAHQQTGRTPPVSITTPNGYPVYRCHACQRTGTAVDALMLARGLTAADAFTELRHRAGMRPDRPNGDRPKSKTKPKPAPKAVPAREQFHIWHKQLVGSQTRLDWVWSRLGWSRSTLERLLVGWDGERLVIPVEGPNGELVSWLRYKADAQVKKMLAPEGHERYLYPAPETLDPADDEPTFVLEGETDGIVAVELGLRAVARPSAKTWKPGWSAPFAGQRVCVLADGDADGRDGASKVCADLAAHAAEVRLLDLAPERDDGYDLGDLWREFRDNGASQADVRDLILRAAHNAPIFEPPTTSSPCPDDDEIEFIKASTVAPANVRWAWAGWMPLGMLTLLVGLPGRGKTTLAEQLAADITRGRLAGNLLGNPATVLLISYEDALRQTLVPRLMAADADRDRIEFVTCKQKGQVLDLVRHLPSIERRAARGDVGLIVVDPLVAGLPRDSVNSHRDQDVRSVLAPLAALAAEHNVAVVATMHFSKSATSALLGAGGSIGFIGAARSILVFGLTPTTSAAPKAQAAFLRTPSATSGACSSPARSSL